MRFRAILNAETGYTLRDGSTRRFCGVHDTRGECIVAIDRAIIDELGGGGSPGKPDIIQVVGHQGKDSLRTRIADRAI